MAASDQPLRAALWPFGLAYGAAMAVRNWAFDAGLRRSHRLPVPVVSVGNLTVGGTGKTPTVQWLCARARAAGKRPGVLARGYGRAPGAELNDEGAMLQAALPWLLQEQDPDRVAAGARLLARGADFVVLDDGLQHRRLHRDLDLVCLDARMPFGNGLCLPAGDLREFRSGLRRAGLVLLTRAEGLDAAAIAARAQKVRDLAGQEHLPVHATSHGPVAVRSEPDGTAVPLATLRGQPVVLLSAIARPGSFRATVEGLGARVVQELRHRDHHRFTAAEAAAAVALAERAGGWLLTTEKDAPKLRGCGVPFRVLRIALTFLGAEPSDAELRL
ncbi:MAG: tetraacyldisaccharide 4'-kinase [Planctomycetes bacterium]|nr:tetraacyldisaccharide 4'-kinase [Planctomycetota bacterium]